MSTGEERGRGTEPPTGDKARVQLSYTKAWLVEDKGNGKERERCERHLWLMDRKG